jgi:hypothetical protein
MSDEVKAKITPAERKNRTAKLREKHQSVFDALGDPEAVFIPKMAHYVTGLDGLHMGFFASELDHGNDIYTEMVSKYMESEDENRTLYKIKYNAFFKDEYETSEPTASGSVRYFVPVDEMEIIKNVSKPKQDVIIPYEPVRGYDINPKLADATLKDFASIILGIPNSEHEWLNEMIKSYNLKKKK